MKYILMHKTIPVVEIEIDEASSSISTIGKVYSKDHVPLGIPVRKGEINRGVLNEWWKNRAIPASRDGIGQALLELNVSTTQKLLDKSFGLSLSDHYWICPEKSNIKWEDVNFFENTFSDDVGNILFGMGSENEKISLMSPDNTSDGWLKKKWKIIDGKRCLIKGGSGATWQEPYNEVFASKICDRLGIFHIPYTLIIQEDYPYSVCENFVTPSTELISAWYVMQTDKKENHISIYQHYLNCCERLGIPNIEESLNQMIVLDYLILNEDRHQNNFGVIRNTETLEWIGAAPIFDSGTSLWHSKPISLIEPKGKVNCKPFKNNHEDQIKLVTSFEWLDLSLLNNLENEFREIVKGSLFIDNARADAICVAIKKRVEMLHKVVNTKSKSKYFAGNDTADDVEEDVKYTGKDTL